jgi:thiol:disulfide interchange protein
MAPPPRILWPVVLLLLACPLAGWMLGQVPAHPTTSRTAAQQTHGSSAAPASASAPEVIEIPEANQVRQQVETPLAPTPIVSEWTSYSSALAESQRNEKPILIDFNAEWCGPCRRMKQMLFDDGDRGRTVQTAVIPVSITDRAREDGRNPDEIDELQQRYHVDAFPTLIVFSPRTGRTMKTQGFGDPDQTLLWIQQAAGAVR